MKRRLLIGVLVSSLALAAPLTYLVVRDGAPDTFERQVDDAYAAWKGVPATTLSVAKQADSSTRYQWRGDADILFNPDTATRTLITTDNDQQSVEVQVNPDQPVDLPSALLIETGLRLGLTLEPGIDGKRSVTDADRALLRAQYSPNGDMNGDGKVNVDDLELFAVQFGKTAQGANARVNGDFNGDGAVNNADLEIMRANYDFGADQPETLPVASPPPSTPPVTPPASPSTPTPPPGKP